MESRVRGVGLRGEGSKYLLFEGLGFKVCSAFPYNLSPFLTQSCAGLGLQASFKAKFDGWGFEF